MLINTISYVGAFIMMEGVAWATHKYIMHGILWWFHKDHHQPSSKSFFQFNDFFFLVFATPGIGFIYWGTQQGFHLPYFWIGLGITTYGIVYFLVHDLFIHQRFKIFTSTDNFYLKAIRRAHKVHHKHLEKHNGECFGMLWAPLQYFKKAYHQSKQS